MATTLEWYDTGGTLVTSLTFTEVAPGTPTAEQVVVLWNNKGGAGADTAYRLWLRVLAKLTTSTAYVASGVPILDNRSIQVRVIQGENLTLAATGYKSLGSGAVLQGVLPDLPNDTGVRLGIRIQAPAGEAVASWDVKLVADNEKFAALESGHYEASRSGLLHRIGDGEASFFWNTPTVVEVGPDNKIDIGDVLYVHEGIPYVELAEDDVAFTLSAAGKERYDVITYGSGGRTITSGSEVTAPATDSDKPTPPTGELVLVWLLVDDTAINTVDIDIVGQSEMCELSDSGTTATVTGGQTLVDNRWLRETQPQSQTMSPSTTEIWWLQPDGTSELATLANRSDPRSIPLHSLTTDGSSLLTSSIDLRTFLDAGAYVVQATSHAVGATGAFWSGLNPFAQSLWLQPARAIKLALHVTSASDDPSTLGYSGGSWIWEIKVGTPGGLTTLFTSSGTDDRRPQLAYSATTHLDEAPLPEVLEWPSGEMLEISLAQLPTGTGQHPAGMTVTMIWRFPVG